VARLLAGVEQAPLAGRLHQIGAEGLSEVLEGDAALKAGERDERPQDLAREGRLPPDRSTRGRRENKRRPCAATRGGVPLHPLEVHRELSHDLAGEVHQTDLVFFRPIDELSLAELPLDAHGAVLEIKVGPLEPETLAQPEAGTQRDEKEKEVTRPCPGGPQKSGLVLRGEGRDPLLFVDRLVQELAKPDGWILKRPDRDRR